MNQPAATPHQAASDRREVRYEHSRTFPDILHALGATLLVSTYQAGKLVVLGSAASKLVLSMHNFDQAMGVAVSRRQIAVAGRTQVWFLRNASRISGLLDQADARDACYLARTSHVTEDIQVHELAWTAEGLWLVNTRFSCLCSLHEDFSFVPRWRPPFVTALAAEDRCHLNGLALVQGRPRYATAHAETDSPAGWRPVKATAGCLIDVARGQVLARGFAMPHSPRVYADRLWVLNSGCGQLCTVDRDSGRVETVCRQPGYTRGLAFAGPYAFIGLSRIRETSTFGGVPIAEDRDRLKCGIGVFDLRIGRVVAWCEFASGVDELFDVQVLRGVRNPLITGPFAMQEGGTPIWVVPQPGEEPPDGAASRRAAPSSAVEASERGLATVPPAALAHYQRGNQWCEQDRFDEAAACLAESLRVCPEFAEAHCNLGVVRQFQGRLAESAAALRTTLSLRPQLPAAHFNLAMTLFLQGDLPSAWQEYEWRWKCPGFGPAPVFERWLPPRWDGSPLRGKSLIVFGEQGVGDEVMFASCLADVLNAATHCVVVCDVRLVPLLSRSFPTATVIPAAQLLSAESCRSLGNLDWCLPAGSLPRHLRPDLAAFPRDPGYLRPDCEQSDDWRQRLAELGSGPKIGISWKGGKDPVEQRRRGTSLDQWQPVLRNPQSHFISLQYGACQSELEDAQQRLGVPLHAWPEIDPLVDLDRFAALISALDLVITIDNSTLHLSAALGVPTWGLVAFPSASYWRWFGDGQDCAWYGALRLWRKKASDTWEELFAQLAAALPLSARQSDRRIEP